MSEQTSATPAGPGWGPYIWPMVSFLVLVEISRHVPQQAGLMLALKVAVPGLLMLWYARAGSYPELGTYGGGVLGALGDVVVGVVGAAVWVVPFVIWPSLRPTEPGFDPTVVGPVWAGWLVRGLGYVVVTALVEELFVRSWLTRFAEVWDDPKKDFRDVAIGAFSWTSFFIVVAYFVLSHAQWEWPVAAAWIVLTQLWFYRRKSVMALVVVHAVSNLAILGLVIVGGGRLSFPVGFFV